MSEEIYLDNFDRIYLYFKKKINIKVADMFIKENLKKTKYLSLVL